LRRNLSQAELENETKENGSESVAKPKHTAGTVACRAASDERKIARLTARGKGLYQGTSSLVP
jgi:hypothetical protein